MIQKFPIANSRLPSKLATAFSMVELLVAMTLLSLIVLALMAVFSSTQRAFRASVTQTDVLEGSRAALDLISTDLRTMIPSGGNYWANGNFFPGTVVSSNGVNFFTMDNSYASCSYNGSTLLYQPMKQSLPGSATLRSYVLNFFFLLGRNNQKWTGVGYVVDGTNSASLYPLYRFYAETNINASPTTLYWAFINAVNQSQWTNMSHVLDGVVHLAVRPYDNNGFWMTNYYQYQGGRLITNRNTWFVPSPPTVSSDEVGCYFFSNAIPSAVELQLGVLEDRPLARVESLGGGFPGITTAQSNYLSQQSGHVHLFRQRVAIPNVDPSAYQ